LNVQVTGLFWFLPELPKELDGIIHHCQHWWRRKVSRAGMFAAKNIVRCAQEQLRSFGGTFSPLSVAKNPFFAVFAHCLFCRFCLGLLINSPKKPIVLWKR
jgi:hypothetical protein